MNITLKRIRKIPYALGLIMRSHARSFYKFKLRRQFWYFAPRIGMKRLTIDTRHGRFAIDTSDQFISKALYMTGGFEYEVIERAIKILVELGELKPKRNGILLDVGANIGTVCVDLLRKNVFSQAIAFEPHPGNYKLLQRNAKLNGLSKRIKMLEMGLSSQNGELVFELSPDNSGDHRIRMESKNDDELFDETARNIKRVPVRKLDDVLKEQRIDVTEIGLLWMDIQGHEWYVLEGAESVIAHGVPMVIEFWPYGLQRANVTPDMFIQTLEKHFTHMVDIAYGNNVSELTSISNAASLYDKYKGDDSTNLILIKK